MILCEISQSQDKYCTIALVGVAQDSQRYTSRQEGGGSQGLSGREYGRWSFTGDEGTVIQDKMSRFQWIFENIYFSQREREREHKQARNRERET